MSNKAEKEKRPDQPVCLRPHHGLCLGFFEGRGYSDSFSRHMAAVLNGLQKDTVVRLKEGADDVCAGCPNLDTGCPGAARYDESVLAFCRLQAGQELTWEALQKTVAEKIIRAGKLEEVCGNCQWNGICANKEYKC